ncbi:SDR family NAD(P)-dependent oxidoreductase [Neorhizobium sp. P12A]|uniref:SDR family NAD(P)-dependent oxidoreductase n=1 Tax=Neorhizobium sp. P12A TaxID=2268027 RepID=UPI0011EC1623|nr:SDR family NAD(P)-dependent oxidoreductase [Neorhizobium sp. P12A]KAA0687952.1 SDR family NAD(P)-dependent oxidoreductase [Neorhizobium sp. P12A]
MGSAQQKTGLAVVTGASSGIGFELAKIAASKGYDLIIAADEEEIKDAAAELRRMGANVDAVLTDLSTVEGVDRLAESIEADGRSVDLLFANAGRGLGKGFLDQDFAEARRVIDTNVVGTIYLIQQIGNQMRARGAGKILVTGSIAGFIPGSYQAVYNGSKAFLNSFSFALRNELQDTGVTVSCLMPGPTDTRFFERADMLDTDVGQAEKDDPADVAKVGFDAMMDGEGDVVAGWKNKFQAAMANVTPASVLATQHAKMAAPGTAKN